MGETKAEVKTAERARPAFQWDDPFLLDAQLERRGADDPRHARAAMRRRSCCRASSRPIARRRSDPEIFREMGALGLLGLTLPADYGCAGASYVSYGLVAREVERVDSGYRSMMSVQSSLVMYPIWAYGDESQRQEISAEARDGRMDRLLRADRAGRRLRSRQHDDARRDASTAAIASPARRCGFPMRRSPTSSSSGRSFRTRAVRMTAPSAASCWRRA